MIETPQRIEPARLDDVPEKISDLVAELSAASAKLESALSRAHAHHLKFAQLTAEGRKVKVSSLRGEGLPRRWPVRAVFGI